MEYHSFLYEKNVKRIKSCIGVSVSLRSYIHSYLNETTVLFKTTNYKFPSPYRVSFILIEQFIRLKEIVDTEICFRLLMEYHSFL